jgi:hypothetical protein
VDEREKAEEQVEDLETPAGEAEEVKGGSFSFRQGDGAGIWVPQGSPAKGVPRPEEEAQHNETLIRI